MIFVCLRSILGGKTKSLVKSYALDWNSGNISLNIHSIYDNVIIPFLLSNEKLFSKFIDELLEFSKDSQHLIDSIYEDHTNTIHEDIYGKIVNNIQENKIATLSLSQHIDFAQPISSEKEFETLYAQLITFFYNDRRIEKLQFLEEYGIKNTSLQALHKNNFVGGKNKSPLKQIEEMENELLHENENITEEEARIRAVKNIKIKLYDFYSMDIDVRFDRQYNQLAFTPILNHYKSSSEGNVKINLMPLIIKPTFIIKALNKEDMTDIIISLLTQLSPTGDPFGSL